MLNTSSAQVGESVSHVEPNPKALWLATKIVENAKSIVLPLSSHDQSTE